MLGIDYNCLTLLIIHSVLFLGRQISLIHEYRLRKTRVTTMQMIHPTPQKISYSCQTFIQQAHARTKRLNLVEITLRRDEYSTKKSSTAPLVLTLKED